MTDQQPATTRGRRTDTMLKGRQADSTRRRQRVTVALATATAEGTEISVSGIARAASVDRSFLYRHRDLLERIHALEGVPPPADPSAAATVTRASLLADLLAAHERALRLAARVQQLEHRLSEVLGEQAWRQPVRHRRARRHQRPQPEDHQPGTRSPRHAAETRGTRRRPGRGP